MSDDPKDVSGANRKRVRAANEKGEMGPGEVGGGYGSQRFDTNHHGGAYGGNEGAGGGYPDLPRDKGGVLLGQQHMSGRYGGQAYGRLDGGHSGIPRDPSQLEARPAGEGGLSSEGGAEPQGDSQNAMLAAGGSPSSVSRGSENERNSPGISTDKASDDTKA